MMTHFSWWVRLREVDQAVWFLSRILPDSIFLVRRIRFLMPLSSLVSMRLSMKDVVVC